jgi:hypothetical protein
MNDPYYLL